MTPASTCCSSLSPSRRRRNQAWLITPEVVRPGPAGRSPELLRMGASLTAGRVALLAWRKFRVELCVSARAPMRYNPVDAQ